MYEYNKDVDDILVDELIKKLKKEFFNSSYLTADDQSFLIKSVAAVDVYKNLSDSDICFIKKK